MDGQVECPHWEKSGSTLRQLGLLRLENSGQQCQVSRTVRGAGVVGGGRAARTRAIWLLRN